MYLPPEMGQITMVSGEARSSMLSRLFFSERFYASTPLHSSAFFVFNSDPTESFNTKVAKKPDGFRKENSLSSALSAFSATKSSELSICLPQRTQRHNPLSGLCVPSRSLCSNPIRPDSGLSKPRPQRSLLHQSLRVLCVLRGKIILTRFEHRNQSGAHQPFAGSGSE